MKRFFLSLVAAFALVTTSLYADNDRVIQPEALPQEAQKFIREHFAGATISYAKQEREVYGTTGYEVIFSDGSKVEFNKKGIWCDIKCRYTQVPSGVVPAPIAAFVNQKHPQEKIVQLERNRKDYEVNLSNGLELIFDLAGNLTRYDD